MKKIILLGLAALLIIAAVFTACSRDNIEEIQLTTTDKLNILFKSSEYKNTMKELDEITSNINYGKFSLQSALNENNTFNDNYINNNLSSTKYKSIQDFKSHFNKLFVQLQFLKKTHAVLNPSNFKEIALYFEKEKMYFYKEDLKLKKLDTGCAEAFSECNKKATEAFIFSMAAVPTCGIRMGYCFGLAILQYNNARGDCKVEVFNCLGITES
jgi:hypothetical protein